MSEPRIRVNPPYGDTLARIRGILRRYLSPIIVDSVLDKAIRQRDASAGRITQGELAELTGDIMIGLRLFVPEERLPQLMLELAEALELGA